MWVHRPPADHPYGIRPIAWSPCVETRGRRGTLRGPPRRIQQAARRDPPGSCRSSVVEFDAGVARINFRDPQEAESMRLRLQAGAHRRSRDGRVCGLRSHPRGCFVRPERAHL